MKWYIYIVPFPYKYAQRCIAVYPQWTESIYCTVYVPLSAALMQPCNAVIHFTDLGSMQSWVEFGSKDDLTDTQPFVRPGIEPGTLLLCQLLQYCITEVGV